MQAGDKSWYDNAMLMASARIGGDIVLWLRLGALIPGIRVEDAVVVLRVLQVVLRHDAVAGRVRVAGKC